MSSLNPKLFAFANHITVLDSYIIDEETLLDLVDALTARGLDLTASQAAKLSYIKTILELENEAVAA